MKKFKIWNAHPYLFYFATLGIFLMGVGAAALTFPKNATISGYIVGALLWISVVFLPLFLIFWFREEITYDGKTIKVKNIFREKVIDIKDINKVDYHYHSGSRRYEGNAIELYFYYHVTSPDDYDYYSLYDTVHVNENELIKGDHSGVNLLMLYDDIISKYPEKQKSESNTKTNYVIEENEIEHTISKIESKIDEIINPFLEDKNKAKTDVEPEKTEKKNNPWEEISLEDYENHMSLESVKQLQAMNAIMKKQFNMYPAKKVMILGVAGGNGLEHINSNLFDKVYAVDINKNYLNTVSERYSNISDILECLCLDLTTQPTLLPEADYVIANLLIEYIGYDAFTKVITQVKPKYVSCVIQINTDEENWVSDSPYLHAFDRLDEVHCEMEEKALNDAMAKIGYRNLAGVKETLPNGKALQRLDYGKNSME